MNLFLKRLLIFFLPIVVLLISTEVMLRRVPNSYQLKSDYIKKHGQHIETLILGSSHTFYGVNPEYFDTRTFNMANISQSPAIDLAILQSFNSDFIRLKTIIIRLSYDTLFEQLKNSSEDWRLKNYKLYTDIDLDYRMKHQSEVLSNGISQSAKNMKSYYIDDKPMLNCDSLGWGNDLSHKTKRNLDNVGVLVAKKHTADNWDLLESNITNFEDIMVWCSKRNIEVLLVTPPAFKSYNDHLNEKQLAKMIEVGEQLEKMHSNCRYFNFLDHQEFLASDFYDADHLSATGAKKFSIMVNRLIEN